VHHYDDDDDDDDNNDTDNYQSDVPLGAWEWMDVFVTTRGTVRKWV